MAAVADDFDEVHLPVDITVESYETLLLLMASNEPAVLMPTISALREQIKDESIVARTIDRLVELASNFKNDQVLIVISWYLAALAISATQEKWAFDVLSKSGAVPHIVNFSGAFDTPSLSERCFEALVALAEDPVTSREIIANGALEVFKEALKRDDPTIQSQVSTALLKMSTDFENRRAILKSGLFDSLIDFLGSEDLDEEVLGNALQATGNIITDSECVVLFEERMGWKNVFPYLDDADKSIQTYAYTIVAQVSNVNAFQYHFDDDLLQKFINTLNDLEEFDPVVPHLLIIFRNCCNIPLVARALSQQVPLLVDRIYSAQTELPIKETMAEILACLAADANTHSSLLESEQLSRLCKLLATEYQGTDGQIMPSSRSIRKSMILVLDKVCENRSIRSKLHEFGAIEQLIRILHETVSNDGPTENVTPASPENPPAQIPSATSNTVSPRNDKNAPPETPSAPPAEVEAAADKQVLVEDDDNGWRIEFQMIILPMFYKMIGDSKLQTLLIERSMNDLEILISSDFPDILNTSMLILATLAVDDAARSDIANRPQFMQILIKLIANKKVAIRRNALHAINSLAMMPKIAVQFCSFGLIEKLKRFAASSAMINLNLSAFATNALETLCASNIVAKFWVKDIIDFADQIEDGFYSIDPRSENYRSIEDLLNDVIHLRIEALLLDQNRDEGLKEAVQSLADSFSVKIEPAELPPPKKKGKKNDPQQEIQPTVVIPEWPHIAVAVANFVINRMGGSFEGGRIPYEAEVSRCKYKTHSDVVMLGQLQVGAIRHRALLFKYLAQLYGMQVSIRRNREDLSCEVKVKKGTDIYIVALHGNGDVLIATEGTKPLAALEETGADHVSNQE
ncbi:hypothetical protein TRFO_12599 [Tritrichomonas foetus]|uniref:EDR1/CTR1/ARMC3-like peptidase-like domain-containing protein n=1 Tax=Tritrichomonas foetus TaxID=1144522 RepID=A0A1J4L158_9EUKA|nr:hypothetical protein TRFO_12599 [Tritrichomonas foetus]|eukprot:OHT17249.1 hypothetical protein TRFO_12599 [Tritrichomonas foetus]